MAAARFAPRAAQRLARARARDAKCKRCSLKRRAICRVDADAREREHGRQRDRRFSSSAKRCGGKRALELARKVFVDARERAQTQIVWL